MMWIGVVTLFPGLFDALQYGIVGRALEQKRFTLQLWNPRDFTQDKHRTVDDRPFGGGPGMLMKVQPLRDAIAAAKKAAPEGTPVIYASPQGQHFTQQTAAHWCRRDAMIFVAGRYEGIDQRVIDQDIDEEISLGDFVLSGGECALLAMIDATVRLLPGTLGDEASAEQDSFAHGLLDYPHYTRPESIQGQQVPPVLLSGNHAEIARWREQQALGQTWLKRPDLIAGQQLTSRQQALLSEFINVFLSSRA